MPVSRVKSRNSRRLRQSRKTSRSRQTRVSYVNKNVDNQYKIESDKKFDDMQKKYEKNIRAWVDAIERGGIKRKSNLEEIEARIGGVQNFFKNTFQWTIGSWFNTESDILYRGRLTDHYREYLKYHMFYALKQVLLQHSESYFEKKLEYITNIEIDKLQSEIKNTRYDYLMKELKDIPNIIQNFKNNIENFKKNNPKKPKKPTYVDPLKRKVVAIRRGRG